MLLSGTPAVPYYGNLSQWTAQKNFNQFWSEMDVTMPPLPTILAQYPAYSSQFSLHPLQSCSYNTSGAGAPTVLVSASEITAPVPITSTIAGNFVPSTSSADSVPAQVTFGSAAVTAIASDSSAVQTGPAATLVISTVTTNGLLQTISSRLTDIHAPSALEPTEELLPTQATSQSLVSSITSASDSSVIANFPTISRGTNTVTLDGILTTITATGTGTVTNNMFAPTALETTEELLPTKATSQPLVTSTSAQNPPEALTAEGVNLPSATDSAGQASTSQNDDDSVQPPSTPNLGSLIAGGLGVTKVQPATAPSTTLQASELPEVVSQGSQESQAIGNTPFTAANTLEVVPSTATNGATSFNTPGAATAPAEASQEAQQPQATESIISGSALTTSSVPVSSAGAKDGSAAPTPQIETTPQPDATSNNIPAADSVVPGRSPATQQPDTTLAVIGGITVSFLAAPPASPNSQGVSPQSGQIQGSEVATPVTAIVSGSILTSWAVPVSSASPDSGSPAEGQTQPQQQPESNVAVFGGTTLSFLTSPPASVGSEGTFLAGEPTQKPQPVAVTALVSGSIVTSWALPLLSTSVGLGSPAGSQTQSNRQPEPNLAVIGGTTVSFLTALPSSSAGAQPQGSQPTAITALVSGSVVTSYAVALPSGSPGDNAIVTGRTQPSSQPSSQPKVTFAVIGGTTVSFLTAAPSPSAADQNLGPRPEAITAIVDGSVVTSWAVPLPSANPGGSTGDQTQPLPQAELITTTIGGAVVTAWTIPSPTASPANDSPSNAQARPLPSAQLVTTTIDGKVVTAWSIPPVEGPGGTTQTQEALPKAELITTTIGGHAVTAWPIPPDETPGGNAQTPQLLQPSLITTTISGTVVTAWSFPPDTEQASPTQPVAALMSAIEAVAYASNDASGAPTNAITTFGDNALPSGSTEQSDTSATSAVGGSGSGRLTSPSTQTQTSTPVRVSPAAASSSKSGAGWVNVPYAGVLASFCFVVFVLM